MKPALTIKCPLCAKTVYQNEGVRLGENVLVVSLRSFLTASDSSKLF